MKTERANKASLMGAGAGIALFVVFGILPGIYAGGCIGLKLADLLFSASLNFDIFRSLMTGSGMMAGITIGAMVYALGSSILGWILGALTPRHKHGGPDSGTSHGTGGRDGSLLHHC